MKRVKLENQVENIPKKLKAYEMELFQIVKDSGKRMDMMTSSLCVAISSLGKKSNKEIMSQVVVGVKILDGPSKRMRQITKKFVSESLGFTKKDI